MKKKFMVLLALLFSVWLTSTNNANAQIDPSVFACLEQMPEFDNPQDTYDWIVANCPDAAAYIDFPGNGNGWGPGGNPNGGWDDDDWGDDWEEPTVDEVLAQLADSPFADCLTDAPEFLSIEEIFAYLEANCDAFVDFPGNGWGPGGNPNGGWDDDDWGDDLDSLTVEQVLAELADSPFADCLTDAPEFASVEEIFMYLEANCDAFGGGWEEPTVEEVLAQLADSPFADCLTDAPEFLSVEEIFMYLEANCDAFGGGWEEPTVDEVLAQLADSPFADCLTDAPEFASVEEIFMYLEANCDAFGGGWEEPTVEEVLAQLADSPFADCLTDAPEFLSIEEIFAYLEANCDMFVDFPGNGNGWGPGGNPNGGWDDDDWGDDLDSLTVEQVLAELANSPFADCLTDAPEFLSVEEIFMYLEANCDMFVDFPGNGGGPGNNGNGPGNGGGPGNNGNGPGNNNGGGPDNWNNWGVEDELEWLGQYFDECLTDAPDFSTIEEIYAYLEANCEAFNNDYEIEIPECLTDLTEELSLQEFLNYLSANCADELGFTIPECLVDAPTFDNDEDFLNWLAENCSDDGGIIEGLETGDVAIARWYNQSSTTDVSTGISSFETINFSVSPNPATSNVLLQADEAFVNVAVLDISGRAILQQNCNTNNLQLDIEGLSSGLYLVRAQMENGKLLSEKLFVK
ncbi:MAG: T9SS type A sorting domain-containing protein [Chitinophagales bacterium]